MKILMNELRKLPSVDEVSHNKEIQGLIQQAGRGLVVDGIREVLVQTRKENKGGKNTPSQTEIIQLVGKKVAQWLKPGLVAVINATGVILHTNLGRAPLSQTAISAMVAASQSYSSLEYDLEKGERSKRSEHAELLLQRLTGAESALVVNNNAGAVLLVLTALAKHKRVIISRTQLVEIGGGFRVPEVMEQSGAKLVSIGTTNRVHLQDYRDALQQPSGLVMCAHHSNFSIVGFTSEPELKEIVELTHRAGLPLVHDLGSGALLDTARFGVAHEPTVQESLQAGADIVCFSGDKLLGGPQAGIIIGKRELLEKIKKHPLARAVRADKMCLAGLSATLLHFLKGEAETEIPVWKMLSAPLLDLKKRVRFWVKELGTGEMIAGFSMVGGGSLPGENQPTFLLALDVDQPNAYLKRLRQLPVPVIARVEKDRVVFDPRTVAESEESVFLNELKSVLGQD
jgi:L-seryl-tRNA(Ser) seleniumtransferase